MSKLRNSNKFPCRPIFRFCENIWEYSTPSRRYLLSFQQFSRLRTPTTHYMPTKSLTLSVNVCACDWKLEGIRVYRISDYKFICPARNLISCWSQVTTLPTFTISMRIQFLWYQSIDGWIYRIFEEGIESLGHHLLYIFILYWLESKFSEFGI